VLDATRVLRLLFTHEPANASLTARADPVPEPRDASLSVDDVHHSGAYNASSSARIRNLRSAPFGRHRRSRTRPVDRPVVPAVCARATVLQHKSRCSAGTSRIPRRR
jgi:hypothetical protein